MKTGKKQFISDLEAGARADSIFMVAKKQVRKKKNGDDYCTVTLQDKEGSIGGVLWTEIYRSAGNFTEGDLVAVEGDVKEYKGIKQLVINSIKKIENKEDIELF